MTHQPQDRHSPRETVSDCCGAKVSWENRKKDEILVEISYAICQKCHKDCKAVFRKNEDRIEAITRGIDRFLPMAMNPKATDDEWLNNWSSLKKYVTEAMREVTTKVEPTVEKWDSLENKLLSVGCEVEATCISEEEGLKRIKALLSHSVQEAKAERDREWMMGMYQMFGNSKGGRVGMAILASLKQEEEK